MTSTMLPPTPEAGAPATVAYHTYIDAIRPADCMGRRTDEGLQDRRWSPVFVYGATQCKSKPVSGYALCETCLDRCTAYENATPSSKLRTTDLVWHGRVDDTDFDSLPPTSHIAGSAWFNERVADGRLRFTGVEKPKTARQERGGGKRVLINDTTLQHFADGRIELDIEELSGRGEITARQLAVVLSRITGSPIKTSASKTDLCKRIRIALRSPKVGDGAAETVSVASGGGAEPKAKKVKKEGDLSALPAGTSLNVCHKGVNYGAIFYGPALIRGDDGVTYTSINKFACACTGRSTNAWTTVHFLGAEGLRPLDALRTPALSVSEADDSDAETVAVAPGSAELIAALEEIRAAYHAEKAAAAAALEETKARARKEIAAAAAAAEAAATAVAEARIAALTAELAAAKERIAALSVFN